MESKGILYLAIGELYKNHTLNGIKALRRLGYSENIRVITDVMNWESEELDFELILVPALKYRFSSRYYKTQLYQYAFDLTLFLDADTIPISSIEEIWTFLEISDLAVSSDLHPNVSSVIEKSINEPERRKPEYDLMKKLQLENEHYYNSGVILFKKNPQVEAFFYYWHLEWLRFLSEDQLAFVRALNLTSVKIKLLPSIWNQRPKAFSSLKEAIFSGVKILHFLSRQRELMQEFGLDDLK